MVRMRRMGIIMMMVVLCGLTGCGDKPQAEIPVEEITYPELDAVAASLEEAGYSVERYDEFEELGLQVERVKAVNGEEYLDVCYDVASADDMDKIMDYYAENYKKYNLASDDAVVYCYSSESVVQSAGLQ